MELSTGFRAKIPQKARAFLSKSPKKRGSASETYICVLHRLFSRNPPKSAGVRFANPQKAREFQKEPLIDA
jgi:hypothetical protein